MDKTGYGIAEETKAGLDKGIQDTLSYIKKKWPKVDHLVEKVKYIKSQAMKNIFNYFKMLIGRVCKL